MTSFQKKVLKYGDLNLNKNLIRAIYNPQHILSLPIKLYLYLVISSKSNLF